MGIRSRFSRMFRSAVSRIRRSPEERSQPQNQQSNFRSQAVRPGRRQPARMVREPGQPKREYEPSAFPGLEKMDAAKKTHRIDKSKGNEDLVSRMADSLIPATPEMNFHKEGKVIDSESRRKPKKPGAQKKKPGKVIDLTSRRKQKPNPSIQRKTKKAQTKKPGKTSKPARRSA